MKIRGLFKRKKRKKEFEETWDCPELYMSKSSLKPEEIINEEIVCETKLITRFSEFLGDINLVECCEIGPIVHENYCPKCGRKIIRED